MKLIYSLFALSFFIAASVADIYANNTVIWVGPTADPVNSKIQEDWSYLLNVGLNSGKGKSRGTFLGTTPWERGWVSNNLCLEGGFNFAPSSDWQFGLQIPISFLSTSFNTYYRLNDHVKFGVKVGVFSALTTTLTAYASKDTFFSLTPSVGFNRFGFPNNDTKNSAEFLATPVYEKINPSRFTLGGQVAVGRHLNAIDLAFLVQYAYAPGNGIYNSFIFDDTLIKHFLKASVAIVF